MSIASEITRINNNIASAYSAAQVKGASLPVTQNSANLALCISSISSGGGDSTYGKYIVNNGVAVRRSGTLPASAFSGITAIDDVAFAEAFSTLPITGAVDLSDVVTVGENGMASAFSSCRITTVDMSSLTTIGSSGLTGAFHYCRSLVSVDFSALTAINEGGLSWAFSGNSQLASLSFPSLTSAGLGSDSCFEMMLEDVDDCVVHFPSNLQSMMSSWTWVTLGFGGNNTTVLFDLPATS